MAARIIDDRLAALTPVALPNYAEAAECANTSLVPFGILNNHLRAAHFLAQVLHESGAFRYDRENLNYTTAAQIKRTWPSRFATIEEAQLYVRKPELLANRVYAGRMGNIAPDDGWRYRGRGAIQITGRDNYHRIGKALDVDFVSFPDLLITPRYILLAAAEFWRSAGLNQLADKDDISAVTKVINGGHTGLAERKVWLAKARLAVAVGV